MMRKNENIVVGDPLQPHLCPARTFSFRGNGRRRRGKEEVVYLTRWREIGTETIVRGTGRISSRSRTSFGCEDSKTQQPQQTTTTNSDDEARPGHYYRFAKPPSELNKAVVVSQVSSVARNRHSLVTCVIFTPPWSSELFCRRSVELVTRATRQRKSELT